MNCSNCEFAAKIKAARQGSLRYEDSPCASCELTEDSSHTIAYDEGRSTPAAWPATGGADVGPEADGGDVKLPLSVLTEAMRGFLDLPPRTLRILQRRYHGDSYRLIGEELQVTAQAVEVQLRRALEAHPHLKSLLPEKARRHDARKRMRQSMARRGKQGSL